MIRVIIELALSWLVLWLLEKKDLGVLGFFPSKKRLLDFIYFFTVTMICCASGFLIRMFWGVERWELNAALNMKLVFSGAWSVMMMLLFEELIFRGVLLYLLIKNIGRTRAIIISSIVFGVHQWFSFGVFGDTRQMCIVFIVTAIMGLLLAYSYAKTFSLYIPIAIHFGWNITYGLLFSKGPINNGILLPVTGTLPAQMNTWVATGFSFSVTAVLLVNFLLLKKHRQVPLLN